MLEIKNLTKKFGEFAALDSLSMTVPRGAVYGLVGPNGAGKTTLIRHITGVLKPDGGEILLEGTGVYEDPAVKMRIGYIADDQFFFHSASIEDMRKFYRGLYPSFSDERFDALAALFDLPRRSPIRKFSKGMKKQAAFWLVMSCQPELLVLDEPVDGLDPVMRRQILSIMMQDVAQRGTTVLVSSHNLRELEDVCDHVGIMHRGRMLLQKSLADMQGGTVKVQLMGEVPAELQVLHRSEAGRLTTAVVRASAEQAEEILAASGMGYYEILPLSLEEIFIYELGGVSYEVKNLLV